MSVERQARRALWRMFFWRVSGELLVLPQVFLRALQAFVVGFGGWFRSLELAVFSLELDAARRYTLLTGIDMGMASGDPGRYGLVNHPELASDAQATYIERRVEQAQEAEDDE